MHGFLLLTSTLQYKHNCRVQDSTPVIRDIMSMLSSSTQSVGTAKNTRRNLWTPAGSRKNSNLNIFIRTYLSF